MNLLKVLDKYEVKKIEIEAVIELFGEKISRICQKKIEEKYGSSIITNDEGISYQFYDIKASYHNNFVTVNVIFVLRDEHLNLKKVEKLRELKKDYKKHFYFPASKHSPPMHQQFVYSLDPEKVMKGAILLNFN